MNKEWIEKLISESSRLSVSITADQAQRLSTFSQMLAEYNQHTNLVGSADAQRLLYDHVLDSLALLPIFERLHTKNNNLIDIGTGAGFPGLPLAIANPDLKITLVDATNKKIVFLESIVQALNLSERVSVINARAEELAHSKIYRASFDYATGRAFGALPLVCELTLPFLRSGGHALLQRGSNQIENEKTMADKIAAKLGATFTESILLDRDVLNKDHYVLIFKQKKATQPNYPRLWKDIKASPIF